MPGLSKDGEERGTLVLYQGKTGSDPVMFPRKRLGVCVKKEIRAQRTSVLGVQATYEWILISEHDGRD